jgi:hypothetical protein
MKLFIGLCLIVVGIGTFWSLRQHSVLSDSSNIDSLPAGAQPVPVLVELFTSEGCSSCPPADVLLSKLAQQPISGVDIIVLSEHVDYWNNLGWRDPFSSSEFSKRQSSYADSFRTNSVYTPQMIVDGQQQFVGSDERKANPAIVKAAKEKKANIELHLLNADQQAAKVQIKIKDLPQLTQNDIAEVLIAVTESNLSSEVSLGENAGQSLKHTAVVRHLEVLGDVAAGSNNFTADTRVPLKADWRRDNSRIVVFIQERRARRVLGAASLRVSAP